MRVGEIVVAFVSSNIFESLTQNRQPSECGVDTQVLVAGVLHDTCYETLQAAHTVRSMLDRSDIAGFCVSKDESDAIDRLTRFNPESLASRLSLLEWRDDEVSQVMALPRVERDALMEASNSFETNEILDQIDQLKSTLTPTLRQLRERLRDLTYKEELQEL